jgi:hypothetical protein
MDTAQKHLNPVDTLRTYSCSINFNIIPPSVLSCPKLTLSYSFSTLMFQRVFIFVRHIACSFHISFKMNTHTNIIHFSARTMKSFFISTTFLSAVGPKRLSWSLALPSPGIKRPERQANRCP